MTSLIPQLICLFSTVLFMVLYASYNWWRTLVGCSVMALAGSIALLCLSRVITQYHFVAGDWLNDLAYLSTAVVMLWRTWAMWQVNHRTGTRCITCGQDTMEQDTGS